MAPVVVTADVTKSYDGVPALRGVSLTIDRGEIFSLIGPNGAGKTTFVRTITGAIQPTTGQVRLFGNPIERTTLAAVGLLPQSFHPPERLSAREIIEYYGGLYDHSLPVEEVLEAVGMDGAGDRWYERLSGGQQRRICVGTALVNDPDLLILDEPTTGIDPAGRRQLWSLFAELQATGRTILLTTHDMAEAATLGDRVGLLNNGQLVDVGTPGELTDRVEGSGRLIIETKDTIDSIHRTRIPDEATIKSNRLEYRDVEPGQIGDILAELEHESFSYERITWEEPQLEDVFFELTEAEGAQ